MPESDPDDDDLPRDRHDPPCEECHCNGRGFFVADDAMPTGCEGSGIVLRCYCACHEIPPPAVN